MKTQANPLPHVTKQNRPSICPVSGFLMKIGVFSFNFACALFEKCLKKLVDWVLQMSYLKNFKYIKLYSISSEALLGPFFLFVGLIRVFECDLSFNNYLICGKGGTSVTNTLIC